MPKTTNNTQDTKETKTAKTAKSPGGPVLSSADKRHIAEGEQVHHFFKGIRKRSSNIRKEFVEFINRGSVIDLAIGVAVGGAFNTIVNSLVNDVIMPIVGLIAGGMDFNDLVLKIPHTEVTIAYGKFFQAVLQFLIIAWVFFMIVKAMNSFHRKRQDELIKIGKAIEKSEKQLANKLDAKAKKDSQSQKTAKKSKLESKIEASLVSDAKRHHAASAEKIAERKAEAKKAKSDSDSSKTSTKLSTPSPVTFFSNSKKPKS